MRTMRKHLEPENSRSLDVHICNDFHRRLASASSTVAIKYFAQCSQSWHHDRPQRTTHEVGKSIWLASSVSTLSGTMTYRTSGAHGVRHIHSRRVRKNTNRYNLLSSFMRGCLHEMPSTPARQQFEPCSTRKQIYRKVRRREQCPLRAHGTIPLWPSI